jgi:glutamine synthetase
MLPDLTTLRRIPWLPGSALVLADLAWHDGSLIEPAPRRVLRHQLDRLDQHGLRAFVATELEFMVFDDTYRQAWANGYRGLTPGSDYNMDYGLLASGRMEPLLRDIRQQMQGAGHMRQPQYLQARR